MTRRVREREEEIVAIVRQHGPMTSREVAERLPGLRLSASHIGNLLLCRDDLDHSYVVGATGRVAIWRAR
jgi:hypothetical protein